MTYACHNHAPYLSKVPAQDGWYADGYTRTPRMVPMPFRMSPKCNYSSSRLGQADQRCQGCTWRAEESDE